jgi:hypothetical protein
MSYPIYSAVHGRYYEWLRRTQMYRAVNLNSVEYPNTDIDMILKPYDPANPAGGVSPPQSEIDTLRQLATEAGLRSDAYDEWLLRQPGADLESAAALGIPIPLGGANIGDRLPLSPLDQRSKWWNIISGTRSLLNALHASDVVREEFNPPNDYNIQIQTFYGTDEETGAVTSETEDLDANGTLYLRIQDILNRERSVVYAPNSQSSAIRNLYFDAAYASTPTRSRQIRVDNIYTTSQTRFEELFRLLPTRPQPKKFTFNNADDSYSLQAKYVACRIIVRLCAVHNAMFGTNFRPFTADMSAVTIGYTMATKMLGNCRAGLQVFLDDFRNWEEVLAPEAAQELEDTRDRVRAENLAETGFAQGFLSPNVIDLIANNADFDQMFSTTFNQGVLTAVPIIHNLYLTTKYFPEVDDVFLGPKKTVLDILKNTINGDDLTPTKPNMARPAAAAAIAQANGLSPEEFGLDAGKFILKMLIETPINILKGLVELIDPHVVVTKLIKTGSATGFRAATKTLDPFAETINERLQEELGLNSNITGKNLMTLLLCVVDGSFNLADEGIGEILQINGVSPPGNFFPDVSMKGVDFTGTVSGMLMVPPTPFGLLYLLLELVKSEIDNITINVDGAAAENAEENEC